MMIATEAGREIMEARGVRPVDLRKRLGLESNTMNERLNQKNISIAKLNEMLRVMDYKIVLMPSDARVGADEYEVE